jgi:hypothetical protein
MTLRQQLQQFVDRETARADQATVGYLDEPTGEYITDAPGNDGYVFVTYGGQNGFGGVVGIAHSFQGAAPKVPIFVRGRGGVARVLKNNDSKTAAYNPSANNNYAYTVQKHTHAIGSGMVDPVEANRFVPGLVRPFSEGGSFGLKVYVEATQYESSNTLTWFPGRDLDLTSHVPGTANKQRWVVVGIDPATNLPTAKSDIDYTIAASMNASQLDGFDFAPNVPLGAVILRNGQTAINTFKDFADLRVFATSNSTSLTRTVVTKTANYTLVASDDVILIDASAGDVTITFPVTSTSGKTYTGKRIDNTANTVTLSGNGNNIDGAATATLFPYESIVSIGDGSDWWII